MWRISTWRISFLSFWIKLEVFPRFTNCRFIDEGSKAILMVKVISLDELLFMVNSLYSCDDLFTTPV